MAFNGFHTARRYQRDEPCLFCRGSDSKDSIEHFLDCPFLLDCMHKKIRNLDAVQRRQMMFFMTENPNITLCFGLFVFSIYSTHNYLRRNMIHTELKQLFHRSCLDCYLSKRDRNLWGLFTGS